MARANLPAVVNRNIPPRLRNAMIVAWLRELLLRQPLHDIDGRACRSFASGLTSFLLSEPEGAERLDVWIAGVGKVASFECRRQHHEFEVISLKVARLPEWVPILHFEVCSGSGT